MSVKAASMSFALENKHKQSRENIDIEKTKNIENKQKTKNYKTTNYKPKKPWENQKNTHTYGYAYGTESGATRRPRVPFPKSTCTKPSNPGRLKRKGGPKHKVEIGDQVEVTAFRA